jgi:pyruvyltransferase
MNRNLVWCLSGNFGDEVGPYLFEKITGKRPVYAQPQPDYEHVVACGSILNWANAKSTVWGAGLASWTDGVPGAGQILAVRGPLSRLRARACGVPCPQVYGDPALLLPRFYKPQPKVEFDFGVVPHYVDLFRAHEWFGGNRAVRIIDPLQPVERVIDQMLSCGAILSSSLHGLIVADAYGIPNAWVRMSSSIGGDGMKYWDYLTSIGRAKMDEPPTPMDWESGARELKVPLMVFPDAKCVNLAEGLWNVCPWRA